MSREHDTILATLPSFLEMKPTGCRTIGEEVDAKPLSSPGNGHQFESRKRMFYTPHG